MRLATLVLALAGCRSIPVQGTPEWCQGRPAPDAVTFGASQLDSLVGVFELVMVRTEPRDPSYAARGKLELWRQDSSKVWQYAFGRVLPDSVRAARPLLGRHLGGALEMIPPDSSQWGRNVAVRDRRYPGVEWYYGVLRLGSRDVLDGAGEDLEVEWVAPGRFGGKWKSDLGIAVIVGPNGPLPNPAGFFCARRWGA